ncbi:hypothetical protein [Yinghuangia sp. YIM S09857]|uniref:hypothetical protein n=1 Tax=Yinghuangia sp. YIM S09857 TaxID=3436929 RepID=UPI003F535958
MRLINDLLRKTAEPYISQHPCPSHRGNISVRQSEASSAQGEGEGRCGQVAASRKQFYRQSKIDDRLEPPSGQSTEFQQIAELSFDNLRKIIDAI